ncbi:hypothetical protein K435DRAFT_805151 [Dendrothele bispora CBS 962.96]|uniref:Uncharacterized protein n=1 Tax=Dendrothele bispora (strain CBS 962.96) TaxID=1314807 RepID=A0A4S8LC40_DENBC|nr:hypothetical protein K435DRAFT_805151 [Dendrothele bispora CBS 962.96]
MDQKEIDAGSSVEVGQLGTSDTSKDNGSHAGDDNEMSSVDQREVEQVESSRAEESRRKQREGRVEYRRDIEGETTAGKSEDTDEAGGNLDKTVNIRLMNRSDNWKTTDSQLLYTISSLNYMYAKKCPNGVKGFVGHVEGLEYKLHHARRNQVSRVEIEMNWLLQTPLVSEEEGHKEEVSQWGLWFRNRGGGGGGRGYNNNSSNSDHQYYYPDEDEWYDDDDGDDDELDQVGGNVAGNTRNVGREVDRDLGRGGAGRGGGGRRGRRAKDDNKALKLRLDLNSDVEVQLKASVRGDLTLFFVYYRKGDGETTE